MSIAAVAALIAAIALAILVLVLIPTITTIRKTAASIATLADLLTNELKPTIRELNEVLTDLKTVGGGVAQHTDDVKKFMSALGDAGDQISTVNRSVGVITGVLGQASIWASGAKVAGSYLLEHYLKRKMKGV